MIHDLIDTVFLPVLNFLNSLYNSIKELSIPVSRPINISKYLGVFGYLGPSWVLFIVNGALLGFIYIVCYLFVAQRGLFSKFKDTIKWW